MDKSQRPDPEEWRQIIDRQRTSGMTMAAYCLEQGITQGSFYTWKRRLRSPAKPTRLGYHADGDCRPSDLHPANDRDDATDEGNISFHFSVTIGRPGSEAQFPTF